MCFYVCVLCFFCVLCDAKFCLWDGVMCGVWCLCVCVGDILFGVCRSLYAIICGYVWGCVFYMCVCICT